ncbi:DUF3899 domain-containing protein [Psychrobacillus lasiicapitis]|uniref:DUF3899 domain-containing protein n=1 Tax=Psychrobacillus lasiicapitis TaxID=1636719 RepID=A0A544TEB3_9BACI|nr:DUF3899 domain-containing protein [Psychrobacillus lasiicapitis]TQR15784.1 DUF3899 domain-containing protein [Psychrobacillus lasiicapitis]GGA18073.1 hypothetical protein GCM10011384_03940 [Psychrobacillus lasiicapitis]
MKKKISYFLAVQLIIFILMFIAYGSLSLSSYINISFYIGGIITFIGLMTYVVAGGFFDLFVTSTRKVFTPKHMKKTANEMRMPSEILSFPYKPIVYLGLSCLVCMGIALVVYYA